MRRLLLLRHAKTERDAPSGRDRDRPLAARGRKDAAELGAWLAGQRSLLPDLALISTAVRARETWDIVQQQISDEVPQQGPAAHLPDLYGAEPAQLLAIIHSVAAEDPERLMIVGHNPGLHELALGLIGGGGAAGRAALAGNLPTSGFAVIDFAVESWEGVAFGGGQLTQFVSPKLLKEA
ncbi:putative phosphohistidine phosphatase, SixA [Nitrobacter hamburgensis X14]|uniref:Putative phosphohistidine phosphatase, SixA n=1 Tax=Nitrobacter hamburgensis (strain DSM 10229 / NCIMB 13809 / X14) TaxID=323097 RepID=Q1QNP5_NITHX|nr:histidine phosphatase family protein [Nitrobacter hamburgensis]ABE62152.1 putative phosphohistidine phosphatase, SixA [Nitrobacter hamburgensis X14]